MLCDNFKVCYFHFFLPLKTKQPLIFTCLQNKCKQTTSVSELSKDFFAVSTAASEVPLYHWTISQFSDFIDLSTGSLDRPLVGRKTS